MKATLATLLAPSYRHGLTVGELAATVQWLMAPTHHYRDGGTWGKSGPSELLSNHRGCVNGVEFDGAPWTSERLCQGPSWIKPPAVPTWSALRDNLADCIMDALCSAQPACQAWRAAHGIGLETVVKVPMAYQFHEAEKDAWQEVADLHGTRLRIRSLNRCHRGVNTLVAPALVITAGGITLSCKATCTAWLRESPCYSRWDVCFLLRDRPQDDAYPAPPRWVPRRETFAVFLRRAAAWYLAVGTPLAPKGGAA